MILIACCLLFNFMASSQNENIVSKEMIRYSVKCELKSELDKIISKLMPVDQKLVFTVDTSIKNNIYQISITTGYDVEIKDSWIGFCEYRGKLFFLTSIVSEVFFRKVEKDIILVNIRKIKKPNEIVQPYIDNLPYWLLEYQKGDFITKLSSY